MTKEQFKNYVLDYIKYNINDIDDRIDLVLRILYKIKDESSYNDENISNAINELQKCTNSVDYLPF